MANRKTCVVCRGIVGADHLEALVLNRRLCPEHKRLRNRMQRIAARARGSHD